MKKRPLAPLAFSALLLFAFASLLSLSISPPALQPVLAHETLERGNVRIVGGWEIEPPVAGELNAITLEITRVSDQSAIANAISQLDVTVRKGGVTKPLEFTPQEEAGLYAAEIIPTQVGQYVLELRGTVDGQAIDGTVEIEDAEDRSRLAFPPEAGGPGQPDPVILEQIRSVVNDLTSEVEEAKVAADDAKEAAQSASEAFSEVRASADRAYLFGAVGVGAGVAGIAIGVIALSRRAERG